MPIQLIDHRIKRLQQTPARGRTTRGPSRCHCEPCPGNTTTVLPTGPARPITTPAPGSPPASPASPAINACRSAPTTTARCSNTDRPANEHPTSTGSNPSSACTWANNRPACAANASADFPETTHGTDNRSTPTRPRARFAHLSRGLFQDHMRVGAADPKRGHPRPARTPLGRPRPSLGQQPTPRPLAQSTCGEGTSTCSVAGITPCRIACTILITPATPAAAWV